MRVKLTAVCVVVLGCCLGGVLHAAPIRAGSPAAKPFAPGVSYAKLAGEDVRVRPAVSAYSVKPGCSNVANFKQFKPLLSPADLRLISANGFVVKPTHFIQMFYLYEANDYARPQKIPSFITTDSMLHAYHIFYDYSLRELESTRLFDAAVKLTDAMLAASQADFAAAKSPEVREAARRNIAFFALVRTLLGGQAAPAGVRAMVDADLKAVREHQAFSASKILGYKVDFTQFVPRGHYTRTEKLKRYFKAMMWYGLAPLPIPERGKVWDERPTRQALLMVRDLRTSKRQGKPLLNLWETIYEPTVFYVGKADDHTPYDYGRLMDGVFGLHPTIEDFGPKARVEKFIREVRKLPGPAITNENPDSEAVSGPQFRLMGQRYIAESVFFQGLTDPAVRYRTLPAGLDVFAVLGSQRALQLLEAHYSVKKFPAYLPQMTRLREDARKISAATWQSSLYWGWLWILQSMVKPLPQGYPAFMRNSAWVDRSLFGALGSWTELRHDIILYAEVSESGGGEENVPLPKGYVEPNLEVWTKLKWLNSYTQEGLASRGLLGPELKERFGRLDNLLAFCRSIAVKELRNQKLTRAEYERISAYGSELEALTMWSGGDIDSLLSNTDSDMAVVADVHTDRACERCLEEGTGRAGAIYVVAPIEGKLCLTRGAAFVHYEFARPIPDRLTDEKWQEMLQGGKQPGLAPWVKSFVSPAPNFQIPAPECGSTGL